MRERERTREREYYEQIIEGQRIERARSWNGRVVIRAKDTPIVTSRQAMARRYLKPSKYTGEPVDTALDGWIVFSQIINKHSGKHRHQGGLVIYIIEGAGYTVVDGERVDWEAGDLLLLPLQPGGCEHQHFNADENKPVKWIAFIHTAIYDWGASELVQLEKHPEYQGSERKIRMRPRR